MIRYGKSCDNYLKYASGYFEIERNEVAVAHTDRVRELYLRQPLRTHCKMCESKLSGQKFALLGVNFVMCRTCGHVTGAHDDTESFCKEIYQEESSEHLARHYASEDKKDFQQRIDDLYKDKAAFLFNAIREQGDDPKTLSYADIGAGSGYFVGGMLACGAERVSGYEVSRAQIDLGNSMLGGDFLAYHALDNLVDVARQTTADVVTMIFVLEHVRQHREVLDALRANTNIKFLFIGVPVFGFSNFVEAAFPDSFARHNGGHTHFYTEHSIDWMCRNFGFQNIGEWWFGADAVDLVRSLSIHYKQRDDCKGAAAIWEDLAIPLIDPLQLAVDRKKLASEVHLVLKNSPVL